MTSDEQKIANDRRKNLIDLYKVCSEEVRFSATTFWQYAVAILGFQGVAIGVALKERTLESNAAATMAALISIALSAMLMRQAHDRSLMLIRVRATERLLKAEFKGVFRRRRRGVFDGYKTHHLARIIFIWSIGIFVSCAGCVLFEVVGKSLLRRFVWN